MAIKKIKLPDNTTEDINDPRLPAVTATDNGKVLSVIGGLWAKRVSSDFVHTSGDETIAGTKTFTSDVEINNIISTENGTSYPSGFGWIQDYGGADLQTALNGIRQMPSVSSSDNGKGLVVASGAWSVGYPFPKKFLSISGTEEAGGYDLNTLLQGGGIIRNVSSSTYWAHGPSGLPVGSCVLQVNSASTELIAVQMAWGVGSYAGSDATGNMWFRVRNNTGWADDWKKVYTSKNITISSSEPTSADGSDGDIWIVI